MWHLVNYERVIINMLLLVGNYTAVALALSTFTTEGKVEFIAGNTVVQSDDVVVYTTVSLLIDVNIAQAHVLIMCLLHAIEVK